MRVQKYVHVEVYVCADIKHFQCYASIVLNGTRLFYSGKLYSGASIILKLFIRNILTNVYQ